MVKKTRQLTNSRACDERVASDDPKKNEPTPTPTQRQRQHTWEAVHSNKALERERLRSICNSFSRRRVAAFELEAAVISGSGDGQQGVPHGGDGRALEHHHAADNRRQEPADGA